jgi:hypothetical protein
LLALQGADAGTADVYRWDLPSGPPIPPPGTMPAGSHIGSSLEPWINALSVGLITSSADVVPGPAAATMATWEPVIAPVGVKKKAVRLIHVPGMGHVWSTPAFPTTRVIWEFFEEHS